MAYSFLLTTRGIPQIYYGNELMMGHEYRGGDDEHRRPNMPGGWPGDERSVFTKKGRTDKENEIFEFTKKLNHWRMNSPAIHEGSLIHFVPKDGVYVYFRVHEDQNVMVIMNQNKEEVTLSRDIFAEILDHFKLGINVINGSSINVTADFTAPGMATSIWDLE